MEATGRVLSYQKLTERDLDFVVETAVPQAKEKDRLKHLLLSDLQFRKGLIGDDKVFQRVMADDEAFVRISPGLYFEILLRKTHKELKESTYTLERAGSQKVAVFDSQQAAELLSKDEVLEYLADMLASFTRVRSYVSRVRVRKGIWRKIRFNDMDIDSLIRLCANVDHEQRFALYKRIADVCLFIPGIFPEYVHLDYRYPSSGQPRPMVTSRLRRSMEDYEDEGKRAYGLAAQHETAEMLGLSRVFLFLRDNFNAARKSLSFLSEHYLRFKRQRLFGVDSE